MALTADQIAKIVSAVSYGTDESFEDATKRLKIDEADQEQAKELWDECVELSTQLQPGQTLSPPTEWS